MSRRQIVDAEEPARLIRERFQAAKVGKRIEMNFSWPDEIYYVGTGRAQLYESNKWQSDPNTTELYKHVAEGKQYCHITKSLKLVGPDGKPFHLRQEASDFNGALPKQFAFLAKALGVMFTDSRGISYQISVPGTSWGAARHPETRQAFLFMYDKSGIYVVVTGDKLDVLSDGIVG